MAEKLDEILENMTDDELHKLNQKVGALDRGRRGGFSDSVDWGSLSDTDFQIRKQSVFRRTAEEARRRRVEQESQEIDDWASES